MKSRHPIVNDLWGGFAAMLVTLPAAIAYGVAAYGVLGPAYVAHGIRAGLLGAIVIGIVAAAFGDASQLISAPSAPAAAVLASFAVSLIGDAHRFTSAKAAVMLVVLTLFSGVLQMLYGALRGGRLIKYIPYPVVAGYLSAVAVMIFTSQVPKLAGLGPASSFTAALKSIAQWQWPALVVGAVAVVAMLAARRVTKMIPAAVVALLAGMGAYAILAALMPELRQLDGNRLLVGPLAVGSLVEFAPVAAMWREAQDLHAADLRTLVVPALTLSVLLSVDSLKTCVIVDTLTFTRHGSNRTLFGQGAGNVASALVGGMPGSGTIGATLVNVESGGATRAAGICEGLFVLGAVVLLNRWLAWIPLAALAGILLVVAFRMFDWNSISLLRQRTTVLDFVVVATVVIVAVTSNLIAAAGAGVGLAMVLFIREQIRGSVIRRKTSGNRVTSKQHRLPAEQAILDKYGAQTTVCELQGSLFFGTTDQLFRELEPDLQTCRYLILDLRRVQSVDYTTAHLFEQFEQMLATRNGWLLFSRVPPRRELRDYMSAHGEESPRNARTFEALDDALQWAEDAILDEFLPDRGDAAGPLPLGEFDLTRELDDDPLAALAGCAAERHAAAGEAIFHAGDASDALYLVRRGVVRVTMPLNGSGYHTLATFGRGHFFGEMAFLVRGTRSANAVATSATDLFVIPRAHFDAASRAHPVLGVKIFARLAHTLATRLRRADAELRAFYDA